MGVVLIWVRRVADPASRGFKLLRVHIRQRAGTASAPPRSGEKRRNSRPPDENPVSPAGIRPEPSSPTGYDRVKMFSHDNIVDFACRGALRQQTCRQAKHSPGASLSGRTAAAPRAHAIRLQS